MTLQNQVPWNCECGDAGVKRIPHLISLILCLIRSWFISVQLPHSDPTGFYSWLHPALPPSPSNLPLLSSLHPLGLNASCKAPLHASPFLSLVFASRSPIHHRSFTPPTLSLSLFILSASHRPPPGFPFPLFCLFFLPPSPPLFPHPSHPIFFWSRLFSVLFCLWFAFPPLSFAPLPSLLISLLDSIFFFCLPLCLYLSFFLSSPPPPSPPPSLAFFRWRRGHRRRVKRWWRRLVECAVQ